MELIQFNALFSSSKLLNNKLFSRHTIAILSIFLFFYINIIGFSDQYSSGILLEFSFTNWVIFAIDVLYIIIVSQFFFLNDTAFFYYALYLVINIYYFHHVIFFGEKDNSQALEPSHDYFFEITLFLSYYL